MAEEDDERTKARAKELLSEWAILTGFMPRGKFLPAGFPRELRLRPMAAEAQIDELLAAESSIYKWWWQFLRANPNYPPQGDLLADPIVAKVYKDFGDLGDDFRTWWSERGRQLFAEPFGPAISVLVDERGEGHEDFPRRLVLEIRMHWPVSDIDKEFRAILEDHHPGDFAKIEDKDGKLLQQHFSFADYHLYPQARYAMSSYPGLLKVWDHWKANQHQSSAKIGEAIGRNRQPPSDVGSTVHGQLERARWLTHHVLRGVFPKDEPGDA